MQRYQLQLAGIHMHIGSGVDYGHLEQVCGAMVRQWWILTRICRRFPQAAASLFRIMRGEAQVDTAHYFGLWNAAREQIARHLGHAVKLEIEPGRFRWRSPVYWFHRCAA